MTAPRAGCSAAPIYRDHHMAVDRWYEVKTPDDREYVFCSGACLLSFSIYGALPADLEAARSEPAEGEAAA